MKVINARNINDAWDKAKILLNADHITRPSRVGEVIEYPMPVTTVYEKPFECVLFNESRNANPTFHFMEALWCLAGRRDIAWLEQFNSKIRDFVGPDENQHGAYGYRWRYAFDLDGGAEDDYADQLPKIIRMLKKSPDERRAVLTMWNPLWDLERPQLKDVPCNLMTTFKIRNGKLDMIVFCRSNDIAFGCYGSNVVQFGFLIEYVAGMLEIPVGKYWQISDSWHAYTARWEQVGGYDTESSTDVYRYSAWHRDVTPFPLINDPSCFDRELQVWMNRTFSNPHYAFRNHFFTEVAEVLWQAWQAYKTNDFERAEDILSMCHANDWRIASLQWLRRIKAKREEKAKI